MEPSRNEALIVHKFNYSSYFFIIFKPKNA